MSYFFRRMILLQWSMLNGVGAMVICCCESIDFRIIDSVKKLSWIWHVSPVWTLATLKGGGFILCILFKSNLEIYVVVGDESDAFGTSLVMVTVSMSVLDKLLVDNLIRVEFFSVNYILFFRCWRCSFVLVKYLGEISMCCWWDEY